MISSMYNSRKCTQLYDAENRSVIAWGQDGEGWLRKVDYKGHEKILGDDDCVYYLVSDGGFTSVHISQSS